MQEAKGLSIFLVHKPLHDSLSMAEETEHPYCTAIHLLLMCFVFNA